MFILAPCAKPYQKKHFSKKKKKKKDFKNIPLTTSLI